MKKQSLAALLFREAAIAGEIAIGRVADYWEMPLVALHSQLMAADSSGLEFQQSMHSSLLQDSHFAFGGNVTATGGADLAAFSLHDKSIAPHLFGRMSVPKDECIINFAHPFLAKMQTYDIG